MTNPLIDQIDALLPQTQCGLCDYAGCRPYATAIVEQGEQLDRCPPGGVDTLKALGHLLNQDVSGSIPAMREKAKPDLTVVIREDECIGCTKCIQACPVDAILGASKQMHTILTDACTGCELCIEPCPVDCIDLIELEPRTPEQKKQLADQSRTRYQQRNQRLTRNQQEKKQKHLQAKLGQTNRSSISARQDAIQAALNRVKNKKS